MSLISNLPNQFFSEQIFYLIIAFSILTVFLLVLVLLYLVNQERKRKNYEMIDSIKNEAYNEATQLLDNAKVKSLRILEESQLKAQRSLENASQLSKESRAALEDKIKSIHTRQSSLIEELGQSMIQTYKDALEKEKKENLDVIDQTSSVLKDQLSSEIDSFKDALKEETVGTQKQIESKLEAGYAEVRDEINRYKQEKIEELNKKIFDIIATVSNEVLGKTIDQETHEKFILELLKDELSKQGFNFKG